MTLRFSRIDYDELNARQQENYNFSKISSVLADYGYVTIRLSDDWEGADFIAMHRDGDFLKVQLKGRLCFYKKYRGKTLYMAFRDGKTWYLYPHDELLNKVEPQIQDSDSWKKDGGYSFPHISQQMQAWLEPYKVLAQPAQVD